MILSCYVLSLAKRVNGFKKQTYYATSPTPVTGEQFIINTRERIKNKEYVPSGLYSMVGEESEMNPLVCGVLFDLMYSSDQECVDELTARLVMEIEDLHGETSIPCINIYEIIEQIRRLRYLLTVHSGLYYDHGVNKISDHEWDAKALKLVELQKQFPKLLDGIGFHDDVFRDFTGDTGMHLPWREPGMAEKIYSLGKQWGVL